MTSPTVQILGAYRLDVTPELFQTARDWKFGTAFETKEAQQTAMQHVREELAGVVLLEILIQNRDSRFSVDDFGQAGIDQAPYSEVFLTQDGQAIVSEGYVVPDGQTLRLAFYLHYVDPAKHLNTSYGTVVLPDIGAMPPRLAALAPYEPVT